MPDSTVARLLCETLGSNPIGATNQTSPEADVGALQKLTYYLLAFGVSSALPANIFTASARYASCSLIVHVGLGSRLDHACYHCSFSQTNYNPRRCNSLTHARGFFLDVSTDAQCKITVGLSLQ